MARLRVTGSRVLTRLAAFLQADEPSGARAAALHALDGIDDPRAMEPALAALQSADPPVVVAALGVLRGWVAREEGTRVLDAVTAAAVDEARDPRIRRAAVDALSDLPRHLVQPILDEAPGVDQAPSVDDPLAVRAWLAADGRACALSVLHDVIARIREIERAEPSERRRLEWLATRGAAHAALAGRGSLVALYDLRETFDAAHDALPLDYVTAVAAIGDASCLEPMARAWDAAAADAWWRERLAGAAAEIMRRTHLSGRSAVVKRIKSKWAGFL